MPTDDGDQPATYRIRDAQGRPIGRVRAETGGPPLGRGAGTVLLIRDSLTRAPADCLAGRPIGCGG
ncbi:MAG: hypothetical protein ACM34D_12285 [Gemmatimonadota bacterium]|jgi:hypothetical protein